MPLGLQQLPSSVPGCDPAGFCSLVVSGRASVREGDPEKFRIKTLIDKCQNVCDNYGNERNERRVAYE